MKLIRYLAVRMLTCSAAAGVLLGGCGDNREAQEAQRKEITAAIAKAKSQQTPWAIYRDLTAIGTKLNNLCAERMGMAVQVYCGELGQREAAQISTRVFAEAQPFFISALKQADPAAVERAFLAPEQNNVDFDRAAMVPIVLAAETPASDGSR